MHFFCSFLKIMYEKFCTKVSDLLGKPVGTGQFGADMKVELLNDGPFTIILDSEDLAQPRN